MSCAPTVSIQSKTVATIVRHRDHVVIRHNSRRIVRLYHCGGRREGLVRVDLSQVKDTDWVKAQTFVKKRGSCYFFPVEKLEEAIRWWYND